MLLIGNAVVFGLLTCIWTKENWFNFVIKCLFMALMVLNVVRYAKG